MNKSASLGWGPIPRLGSDCRESPTRLSERQGLSARRRSYTVAFLLGAVIALGNGRAFGGDLQVTDTTTYDQLDDANQAPGPGDVTMGNGEVVSSFNGNLHITHASSPVLPQNRHLSIFLARSYNSHNVRKYKIRHGDGYKELLAGRSWLGLGWTSHLGRIFRRSRYSEDPDTGAWNYDRKNSYFEFPDGTLYRFEPTVSKAHPNLKIEWFEPCDGSAPPPPRLV